MYGLKTVRVRSKQRADFIFDQLRMPGVETDVRSADSTLAIDEERRRHDLNAEALER